MLDAASGPDAPFEEILVWKFSRFIRKREHAVAFKSMLRHRGVRVTSITEYADDSPTGKLMETSSPPHDCASQAEGRGFESRLPLQVTARRRDQVVAGAKNVRASSHHLLSEQADWAAARRDHPTHRRRRPRARAYQP